MITIGSYQCISKLGQGKNATAYGSVSKKTLEPIVLKVSEKKESFENEKNILSKLHHKGIVKLIDSFQEGTKQNLVLEYGKVLIDHIIENGRFTEKEAKILFKTIFEAVNYLHENKIIHRDIKLDNIIMTEKQNLKLIDFDLSVVQNLKSNNNPVGTLQYMAPELLNGMRFDNKIDIWSLGITLYAAVFGYFPFDSTDYFSYSNDALTQKPYFDLDDVCVSSDFIDLINKMLEKIPSKRISIHECLNHPWFNILSD